MKPLILLFALSFLSCGSAETTTDYTIKGTSEEYIGDTVYVHKYDHFDYLNQDHILDSAVVDSEGNFELLFSYEPDKLVYVSRYKVPPPSYQVFRQTPEHYYYSMCANFFGMSPTIYLGNQREYRISHWDQKNNDSSIKFEDRNQGLLREYYRTVDYRGELADENRTPLQLEPHVAWQIIEKERDQILKDFELNKDFPANSLEGYLKTEISLGAINDYLVWYGLQEESADTPDFINRIIEQYNSSEWNSNSLEFFKLNERYITHQMNLQNGQEAKYYPSDEDKLTYAKQYARPDVRDQYVENLSSLIKEK